MTTIPLTHGLCAMIDDADAGIVNGHKWWADINRHTTYAATTVTVNGIKTTLRMHALIMGTRGKCECDHRDGNGLNNRRENLRQVTRAQNSWNRHPRSGCQGVTFLPRLKRRPWQARIGVNGKHLHLGYYPTKEEALARYDQASKSFHGEFGHTHGIAFSLSDNGLRDVVHREIAPHPNGRGRILRFTLECGHNGEVPYYRRSKVGASKHCAACILGPGIALRQPK